MANIYERNQLCVIFSLFAISFFLLNDIAKLYMEKIQRKAHQFPTQSEAEKKMFITECVLGEFLFLYAIHNNKKWGKGPRA